MEKSICKAVVAGMNCTRSVIASGYCDPHYRADREGRPLKAIRSVRPSASTLHRDSAGRKLCIYCREWLAVSLFHQGRSTADGLQIFCRQCGVKRQAQTHDDNPSRRRSIHLFRRYGLSLEDFESMFEAQGSACAICRTTSPGKREWTVDHDHSHHQNARGCRDCVRQILCYHCNLMLGMARDNAETLRAAAEYLERHTRAIR